MKTIRVVAAVIRDGERIFATARGYGEYKGWWEFPGGKIEDGETPQEALVREIREELTAGIKVGDLLESVEYDYPEFHLSMDVFWAAVLSGHLELKEAEDARWLTAEQLDEVKWLPADKALLEPIRQKLREKNTLSYYEKNAESFAGGTVDVKFGETRDRFAAHLPESGYILDFGCGSGRDTKAFLSAGFRVDAVDGSETLCRLASAHTGQPVRKMLFGELDEDGKYDGIWACASVLHLPKAELKKVFEKMIRALKSGGFLYVSFKYGDFEGCRKERYFTDFTEESFREFIRDMKTIAVVDEWMSADARPGRENEKWLNVILRVSASEG